MIPLAVQTVHTTGINWASIGTIVGCIIAALTYLDIRQSAKQKAIRTEITDAVGHLGDVLNARLETKDEVSRLRERVSKLEGEKQRR